MILVEGPEKKMEKHVARGEKFLSKMDLFLRKIFKIAKIHYIN